MGAPAFIIHLIAATEFRKGPAVFTGAEKAIVPLQCTAYQAFNTCFPPANLISWGLSSEIPNHGGSLPKLETFIPTGTLFWKNNFVLPQEWQSTRVSLPWRIHGRALDYSSCGCKESDATEQLTLLVLSLYKINLNYRIECYSIARLLQL